MTGLDGSRRSEDSLDAAPAGEGPAEDMSDEALARLGAALEPIEPPASLRAELLKRIEHEPQTSASAGAGPDGSAQPGAVGAVGAAGAAGQEGAGGPTRLAAPDEKAGERAERASAGPVAREEEDDGAPPGAVVPLRPRRRRWAAVGLRVAAVIVILGVGIGVGRWTALSSMAPTEHYAHLNQAQDVQRVTDTMPDGHVATLTWSKGMSMTALSLPAEMMDAAAGRSLQVWLRKGDTVSSLGLYDPESGTGFTFLDLMPETGEQVFITQEPAGGSEQPTGEALVTFDVNADGTTTRRAPAPTPDGGGADA